MCQLNAYMPKLRLFVMKPNRSLGFHQDTVASSLKGFFLKVGCFWYLFGRNHLPILKQPDFFLSVPPE